MYLKEFEVKPYKLPKFEISITTDKEEYRVGEELHGMIRAEYFFGQPVKARAVEIQFGESHVVTAARTARGMPLHTQSLKRDSMN